MLKDAITEFVATQHNRLIKPQLNKRDEFGKANSEPQKVIRDVKDRMFKMYYGN